MARQVLLAACVVLSVIFCTVASPYTTPVFLWSNTDYFSGQNEQIVDLTSLQTFETALLQPKSKEAAQLKINANSGKPELIVMFIEPELKTEQVSVLAGAYKAQPNGGVFANLKRLVETSKSSVVVPYATAMADNSIGTNLAQNTLENLAADASVIVASESGKNPLRTTRKVNKMSLKQLTETAAKNWDLLSNGVTDLVVVYLDENFQSDDNTLSNLCASLKTSSYVAIYTADHPHNIAVQKRFPTTHASLADFELANEQLGASQGGGNWPDDVLAAVVIMVPFLFILLTGICCTMTVQTPQKMDAEKPKKL